MNLAAYISSGILESYVLGELSEDEINVLETSLGKYPELREELFLIEEFYEGVLFLESVKPPYSLKLRILNTIQNKS